MIHGSPRRSLPLLAAALLLVGCRDDLALTIPAPTQGPSGPRTAVLGGTILDLGTPDGAFSEAMGISSDGNVVAGWRGVSDPAWTDRRGLGAVWELGSVTPPIAPFGVPTGPDGQEVLVAATDAGGGELGAWVGWSAGDCLPMCVVGWRYGPQWGYTPIAFGAEDVPPGAEFGDTFEVVPLAVAPDGTVVGRLSWRADRRPVAFVTEAGDPDAPTILPYGEEGGSVAEDVNSAGVVVGVVMDAAGTSRAYAWATRLQGPDGFLGTLPGASDSHAHGISEEGRIVGESGGRAFLWTPTSERTGSMTDLGTLGGCCSAALDVQGIRVVGWSTTAAGETHAFLWTPDTGMQDLGHLGGGHSVARAIGGRYIVGFSTNEAGVRRAVRWGTRSVAPVAAGNVTASGTGQGLVNVAWRDASTDESHFRVRRSQRNGDGTFAPYTIVGVRGYNSSSLLDSTAVLGGTYRYQVQACNVYGCSYSVPSAAYTVILPPPAPSALSGRLGAIRRVDLGWSDNGDTEVYFRVRRSQRNPDGSFGTPVSLFTVGANATSASDTAVVAGGVYRYQVQACNGGGCATSSALVVSVPNPPALPTLVAARLAGAARVEVSWTDASGNESSFRVHRSRRIGDGTFVSDGLPATVGANTTSYADTSVAAGETYRYQVQSCNGGGCSGYAGSSAITVPAS